MNDTIKSIFFVLVGLLIGSAFNILLITIGPLIIPPPDGVDVTTVEGLAAGIHLMEPKHFIIPFIAHSFGTFVGAYIAARMAKDSKSKYGIAVGVLFLFGGISMVMSVPTPTWFIVVDLVFAYLPMSWLASKLAIKHA